MKILFALPPADPTEDARLATAGWQPLREPPNIFALTAFSIPVMLIFGSLTGMLLAFFAQEQISTSITGFRTQGFSITVDLLSFLGIVGLVLGHELIHWLFVPNNLAKPQKTFFGLTWFGGFTYSTEEISRNRYLLITLVPYILISLVLPLVLGVMHTLSGYWMFLILVNALSSSVDGLGFLLVLRQIPAQARLTQNGRQTYFKIN